MADVIENYLSTAEMIRGAITIPREQKERTNMVRGVFICANVAVIRFQISYLHWRDKIKFACQGSTLGLAV